MPAFKPEQRHLVVRGRAFHFVSYEGRPANAHRGEDQQPAMWYLMVAGRRFPAFPCEPALEKAQVDLALERWAMQNAMGPARNAVPPAPDSKSVPSKHRRTWWGPS